MNVSDVLKYGHRMVLQDVGGVPESEWEEPGVCGVWSVKEIVAHLASFERVLVDVLHKLLKAGPTPDLDQLVILGSQKFNDTQVPLCKGKSPTDVLAEYTAAHQQVRSLLAQIPPSVLQLTGSLPWYGIEYDLEDFVVYQYYGHKREHVAQINAFKDKLWSRTLEVSHLREEG